MNADDLIAEFNELADVDPDTRINRTRVGDAERVQLVPSYNKGAVQRFKALATDAAALFDLPGLSDPVTRWLRFVLEHAPELVEDCKDALGHSLGHAIEHHDDGTESRVPFIAQTLPNAASASTLVVRRCRRPIEQGEPIERAQVGLTRFGDKPLMTDGQRKLWAALSGRAMTAKELAAEAELDTSEDTVRQWVRQLRLAGYKIGHRPGRGYFRPDAPPTEIESQK